jgi:hypothetical protein
MPLHTLYLHQLYLLHFLFLRKGQNPNLSTIPKKMKRNVISDISKIKINKISPLYSQFLSFKPKFQIQELVPKEKKRNTSDVPKQRKTKHQPILTILNSKPKFQAQKLVFKEKKKKEH